MQPRQMNVVGGPADGRYKSPLPRQRDGDDEWIDGEAYYWHAESKRWLTATLWHIETEKRCQGK